MLLAPPELFKNRLSLASCVQNFDQFVQIISRPRLYIFGINFDIMRRTAIPNPGDSHGHGLRWPQGRGKNAGFHVGKRSWAAANTGIDPFLNGHVTCHVMSYLLSWAKKDDIHDTYWWLLMHVIWFGDANAANGHEPNKKRKYHLDVLLPGEKFSRRSRSAPFSAPGAMFLDRDGLMSLGAQWCGLFAVAVHKTCYAKALHDDTRHGEFLFFFQCWRYLEVKCAGNDFQILIILVAPGMPGGLTGRGVAILMLLEVIIAEVASGHMLRWCCRPGVIVIRWFVLIVKVYHSLKMLFLLGGHWKPVIRCYSHYSLLNSQKMRKKKVTSFDIDMGLECVQAVEC